MLHLIWTWLFSSNAVGKVRISHPIFVIMAILVSVWRAVSLGSRSSRMSEYETSTREVFSLSVRLEMWRGAMLAIAEEPIFGYGPQNRWADAVGFVRPEIKALEVSHPHNLIVTYGMVGRILGVANGLIYIFLPNAILLASKNFTLGEKELFFIAPVAVFSFGLANYVLFEGYMAAVTTLTFSVPYYLFVGQRDLQYHW